MAVADTELMFDDDAVADLRAVATKTCPTCDGSGKIRAGHVTCPDCDGTGKVARSASPHVEIRSEPLTYRARIVPDSRERLGFRAVSIGENRSYVQDLYRSRRYGDRDALDRLQRHGREVAEERSRRVLDLPADVTYELAPEVSRYDLVLRRSATVDYPVLRDVSARRARTYATRAAVPTTAWLLVGQPAAVYDRNAGRAAGPRERRPEP